jgi:hypothetical protein
MADAELRDRANEVIDRLFALDDGVGLVAHAAERERPGYRLDASTLIAMRTMWTGAPRQRDHVRRRRSR